MHYYSLKHQTALEVQNNKATPLNAFDPYLLFQETKTYTHMN